MADKDPCKYGIAVGAATMLGMLDPKNVIAAGCRVRKHPNACPLCVANNDCTKVPVHEDCHCKAEPFLIGAP